MCSSLGCSELWSSGNHCLALERSWIYFNIMTSWHDNHGCHGGNYQTHANNLSWGPGGQLDDDGFTNFIQKYFILWRAQLVVWWWPCSLWLMRPTCVPSSRGIFTYLYRALIDFRPALNNNISIKSQSRGRSLNSNTVNIDVPENSPRNLMKW